MAPPGMPEGQLNLNLSSLSPLVEPNAGSTSKAPFANSKAPNGALTSLSGVRGGAGSPSHEQTSRLFPKRTRELATAVGGTSNIWGPPTSGTSTPLFEIPESPDHDGFPDLVPLMESGITSPARRARAGTLPSRISPVGTINGAHALTSKTSRPTPSTSPFRPSSTSATENAFNVGSGAGLGSSTSTLLSRLRAGSMPQKASLLSAGSAVGQSPFSSAWGSRSRAATLTSIHSADEAPSPQPLGPAKDGLPDPGVRTLDYLGLAESSYPSEQDALRPSDNSEVPQRLPASAFLSNLNARASNRFRSFSVNTQSKGSGNAYDGGTSAYPLTASGAVTPSAHAALEAEYEAVQERVRLHNQAVQAFALNATAARPRARTAGLVETPQRAGLRKYGPPGGADLDNGVLDPLPPTMGSDATGLADSFYDLPVAEGGPTLDNPDELAAQMSRSLWIGSMPNSTTVSSLDAIFARYGPIESTRVLTHKNCGFVNYETVHDAVRARQILNGKEIFPGAGPVRIGFAKAPNNSTAGLPGTAASPALDPFNASNGGPGTTDGPPPADGAPRAGTGEGDIGTGDPAPALAEVTADLLHIVAEFGAQQTDLSSIAAHIDSAQVHAELLAEVPAVPEPSPNRLYDAPRLRDVRKRIDHGTCGVEEMETIAVEMLPEIAELSSDYLGNTVVQKLFEFCSEPVKEQMLAHIAPHLAEIGVHKNGTWAAQKIIEVCRTDSQTQMIVDSLRPYTVPLFLDQYGNYVLQCCLKFGSPFNDFIFETMLSRLWDIAQGRFGARAMRACLESHHATKNQQRLIAAAIALHSVKLATNTNGALLLTWILDTCTFPHRRSVLAPRLVPHVARLCTHKVASLTVLKMVNQRNEPEARELLVRELFFGPDDTTLEQILRDQASGVSLIFKIWTNPFLDDQIRPDVMRKIASALEAIKAQPNQGYKRLMDEVGLASRSMPSFAHQAPAHGKPAAQTTGVVPYGTYAGGLQGYDPTATGGRTPSGDAFGYPNYSVNGFPSPHPGYSHVPVPQINPPAQYGSFPHQLRNTTAYLTSSFGGYQSSPLTVDALRTLQNTGSPMSYAAQMSPLMNAGAFNSPPYPPSGAAMYNYNGAPAQQSGYYFNPSMQPVQTHGRGRRVRESG